MKRLVPTLILLAVLSSGCSKSGSSPTSPGGGGSTNHSPTLNVNTTTTHLVYGGAATITVTTSDPDGDAVTLSYSATGGTVSASGPTATTAAFTAGSQWGPAAVTVTATDGKGGSTQATASMYVQNPNPPAFTLSATGSTACGGSFFLVQATAPEPVLVTNVSCSPMTSGSTCSSGTWYYATPISIAANQTYTFQPPNGHSGCSGNTACEHFWYVGITGRRPEPDGGTFSWGAQDFAP